MGYRIIGVDSPGKEDLVRSSGAEHFLPHTLGKDLPGRIKDLTDDLGASAVIVLTAANVPIPVFSIQKKTEEKLIQPVRLRPSRRTSPRRRHAGLRRHP